MDESYKLDVSKWTDTNYKVFSFRYYLLFKNGQRDLSQNYRVSILAKSRRDAVQWCEERTGIKIDVTEWNNSIEVHSISYPVIAEIVKANVDFVRQHEERQLKLMEEDKKLFQEKGRLGLTLKK